MLARLAPFLARFVRHGTLEVVPVGLSPFTIGDGSPPRVRLRFLDRAAQLKLMLDPELELGEGYMDGRIVLDEGSIYDLLEMVAPASIDALPVGAAGRFMGFLRRAFRGRFHYNPIGTAGVRVRSHYDLSDALFDLFLDEDRQYSCAYFTHPEASLEEAQRAKKRHIMAKLRLRPGLHALDIGSGWGGLGSSLAEAGCRVTGVTLSRGQWERSNARAAAAGLSERAEFRLLDYRELKGPYDRIVSVGMLEHVGSPHFLEYFRKISDLLADDGVALVHAIGRTDGPGVTNPWITRHIFPGGYIPALSEVVAAIEKSRLVIHDIETLHIHYAETLRHWRERFLARRAEAAALYDERFVRMWEFYLAGSEASFRDGGHFVFQIQLTRHSGAVPITRDYIGEAEAALAAAQG